MPSPKLYETPEDAVRAAAASMSFDVRGDGGGPTATARVPASDPGAEDRARARLDDVLRGIRADWSGPTEG